MKTYYVYILSNKYHTVFYTGLTNNLSKRLYEHKAKLKPKSFTAKYNIFKLLYYEAYDVIYDAMAREKQLKKYKRGWKYNLIDKLNPEWEDLYSNIC